MRLGFGEFEGIDGVSWATVFARHQFWSTVGGLVPDVVKTLEEGPFRIYSQLWSNRRGVAHNWNTLKVAREFCDQFEQWSNRWNLNADWCRNLALYDMDHCLGWRIDCGEEEYPLRLSGPELEPDVGPESEEEYQRLNPPPAPSGLAEWVVLYETREDYLESVRSEAKEQFLSSPLLSHAEPSSRNEAVETIVSKATEYCDRVETHFKGKLGWQPIKHKPMLKLHVEWAVRYQVEERECHEIAKMRPKGWRTVGGDSQTSDNVRIEMNRILKLIDLKPRKARRGAPPQTE